MTFPSAITPRRTRTIRPSRAARQPMRKTRANVPFGFRAPGTEADPQVPRREPLGKSRKSCNAKSKMAPGPKNQRGSNHRQAAIEAFVSDCEGHAQASTLRNAGHFVIIFPRSAPKKHVYIRFAGATLKRSVNFEADAHLNTSGKEARRLRAFNTNFCVENDWLLKNPRRKSKHR